MPRKAKRTQPVEAPQEQGYGVRGEQIASQRAMPLPDNRTLPTSTPSPAPQTQAPPAPPVAGGSDPIQAMLAAAEQMPPAGVLNAPSAQREQPITAGLASGAGPGPDAVNPGEPKKVTMLREIARVTGDPAIARLVERVIADA